MPVGAALRVAPLLALTAIENIRQWRSGLRWLARGRRHYGM